MLQLIPALLLILLQSGAEPDVARVRSHALSLMMGVQVRSEMSTELDKAVGENLSEVQIQVLLGILADEPIPNSDALDDSSDGIIIIDKDVALPDELFLSSTRSRDGPASL